MIAANDNDGAFNCGSVGDDESGESGDVDVDDDDGGDINSGDAIIFNGRTDAGNINEIISVIFWL